MKFSQRVGQTPPKKLVQYKSIDRDLRNGLWNAFTLSFLNKVSFPRNSYSYTKDSNLSLMITNLWMHQFKLTIDRIPLKFSETKTVLRERFYDAEWYKLFDFLEACVKYGYDKSSNVDYFIKLCNFHLERENSAYRFINR